MSDFQKVYNAVKNETAFLDTSSVLGEAVSLLNQIKTIYDQHSVPTTTLVSAISQLSNIDLSSTLSFQTQNVTRNLEVYRMYVDLQIDLEVINKYTTTYRYDEFFGSLSIPSYLKSIATDRLERMSGDYPEILPQNTVWLGLIAAEIEDIQDYADKLVALNEPQMFDDALTDIEASTKATSILNYMNTSYGLALLSVISDGDVRTVVEEKIAEINSNNGYDDTSTDYNDPVGDDQTPFYEIVNDITP